MKILAFSLIALLGFHGCAPKPVQPPGQTRSETPLVDANAKRDSKLAANAQVTEEAILLLPDSPPRSAALGTLSVLRSYLPNNPFAADLEAARALKDAALRGDLIRANSGWTAARGDADRLQSEITQLRETVRKEREEGQRIHAQEIADAKNEAKRAADAKLNLLLQLGCFGGGALCIILAIVAGQMVAAIPFIGPNIIKALFLAGGVLLTIGALIRSVDRFVDQHPQLFFGGLIVVVLAVLVAVALAWSNHHHEKAA